MINSLIAAIFGTQNERFIKKLMPRVERINALEPEIERLSDDELRAKTAGYKAMIQQRLEALPTIEAEEPSEYVKRRHEAVEQALDEILEEAFAVVREGGRRALGMRHFDVQMIGGMVLHQGKISEMKTGEGKTLVATLPVYLNALSGEGVHVVTVNDYLAKRDSEWMGKLYSFLGLSVGVIVHDLDDEQRRAAYAADITYGTNNEFGFDYLRDNMKFDLRECVQRPFNFSIVDEVDSILIDEARTPLIIAGASEESTDKYAALNIIPPRLEAGEELPTDDPQVKVMTGDFVVDEKHKSVAITEQGWLKVERLLNISNIADPENWSIKHHVETAVRAHAIYKRDVDYVVKDGEVIIVDEFTGRLMPGRRWSDGLHQAIEAKEGVKVERENQTLATITFQNYFRMYQKLAGMTGTAETEASEFDKIYKLEVVVIPTNRKMSRIENPDVVYRTEQEKYLAAADSIAEIHATGQPVLVGTTSIEKSEKLSDLLKKKGIEHVVLNAKNHEREAEIVAQAGRLGQVTIATNMAGRGTDILLGGNPEFMAKLECLKKGVATAVQQTGGAIGAHGDDADTTTWYYAGQEYRVATTQWQEALKRHKLSCDVEREKVLAAGGLFILGTERHESRRIDNQLRGRAGRQGDPGASRFFLSLEDDLMRIFAKEWVSTLLQRLGMEEGVPIESGMISRRIEAAQKSVETQNFESRKHLIEYDDVMNKQREAVYGLRRQLLEGVDQKDLIQEGYTRDLLADLLDQFCPEHAAPAEWETPSLKKAVLERFSVDVSAIDMTQMNRQEVGDSIFAKLLSRYAAKEKIIGPEEMRKHERIVMFSVLDGLWKDHLLQMDYLKEGIGLRGYAQRDPLVEYKKESYSMFNSMMSRFEEDTIRILFHMQLIDRATGRDVFAQIDESGEPSALAAQNLRSQADDLEAAFQRKKKRELESARMASTASAESEAVQQVVRGDKVGRNDLCPCGSGKKYKKCCGAGQ